MKGLKELSRPAWLRYGIAAASSVVALLLTSLLWPIFRHMPNMPSFLAVFFVGWIAGGGPSLLTLVLCTLGILYFFSSPSHSLRLPDPESAVRLAGFVFVAGALIAMWPDAVEQRRLAARYAAGAAPAGI